VKPTTSISFTLGYIDHFYMLRILDHRQVTQHQCSVSVSLIIVACACCLVNIFMQLLISACIVVCIGLHLYCYMHVAYKLLMLLHRVINNNIVYPVFICRTIQNNITILRLHNTTWLTTATAEPISIKITKE